MNRLLRVLLSLDFFLLGVLLLFLPWLGLWEHNYFLSKYPAMIPYALHPSVRGAVSGLGALDIVMAFGMLRSDPARAAARH
ncbi:MAG: hypothetical protein ABSA32_07385 [Candidatus Acidiferrales bacterium]|jgi:hypothetical protein